jgi:hypothetical protein
MKNRAQLRMPPIEGYCYDPTLIKFLKFQPFLIISAFFAGLGIRGVFGKQSSMPTAKKTARRISPGATLSGGVGLGSRGR